MQHPNAGEQDNVIVAEPGAAAPSPVPPPQAPALVLLTIGLISWTAYGRSRWATRPIELDSGTHDGFRVDLNRADRVQLLQLPGAGDNVVAGIESYRRQHRGFRDIDELRNIKGIGPALVERWRNLVCVSPLEGDEDADEPPMPQQRVVVRGAKPDSNPTPMHGGGKKTLKPGESIDINKASLEELQRIPGVGQVTASHIVEARDRKAFTNVNDLLRVAGIKQKTLDKLRPYVRVE
jgi:competence protein ComEA